VFDAEAAFEMTEGQLNGLFIPGNDELRAIDQHDSQSSVELIVWASRLPVTFFCRLGHKRHRQLGACLVIGLNRRWPVRTFRETAQQPEMLKKSAGTGSEAAMGVNY